MVSRAKHISLRRFHIAALKQGKESWLRSQAAADTTLREFAKIFADGEGSAAGKGADSGGGSRREGAQRSAEHGGEGLLTGDEGHNKKMKKQKALVEGEDSKKKTKKKKKSQKER
jgi:hypothetical protein